ncbi:hypothetical protein TNIN_264681 [Trichonephila inaurata madagascariensis]|uniref:Uncharacterized protein n=1 Tax=Trichonephila inaurata madagascariensis TaxID=2747483 RepID=A0A8X6YLC8_9ARAC|nr:hypothetical protein TNIN_264681 [Trichonephila inaurata madagascariensis]
MIEKPSVESRNISCYKSRSTAHIHQSNSYSSEAKWTFCRSWFGGVYFTTSKWAYQPLHEVAEYVKRLGILLSMNAWQGISFKNSGWKICPSVMKLEQDDHRPWMTEPCRRPLRRTVVKRVVNLPDNSTLPVKLLDSICTT